MLVLNIGKKIIVIDNSGVRFAKLISVLRKKKNLDVGNVVLVAISKVKKKRRMIKKSSVTRAVIVRSNNNRILSGGHIIRCDNKAIILLKENGDLLSTRILGLVSSSLRFFGFTKILSISNYIY